MASQPSFIVTKCPHCRSEEVACDISGVRIISSPGVGWAAYCTGFFTSFCRKCKQPFGGEFECVTEQSNANWAKYANQMRIALLQAHEYALGNGTRISRIWPEIPKPKRFDYLPIKVDVAMRDAEGARSCKAPNRVVRSTYRTVIDVATQHIFKENPASFDNSTNRQPNLHNRINMLAAEGFLTPSLRDWAHGIRDITNEDIHTSSPVSDEEVAEIAEFTDMLLQYLFELPGRVKQAKETAEQKRAAAEADA